MQHQFLAWTTLFPNSEKDADFSRRHLESWTSAISSQMTGNR